MTGQRVFFCVLMSFSGTGIVVAEEKASEGGLAEPLRALYYTETLGYKHSVVVRPADGSLSHSERVLKEIADKSGAYTISFSQTCQDLTPERLQKLDVLVVYCCDLPPFSEEQRKGLLDFVRSGGGFVGIHGATIVWYGWPEIGVMMGAFFDNHPWNANASPVTVKIEQPTHPVVRMFGDSLRIQDEIYQFKEPYGRSKTHVLMSLDTSKTDMTVPGVHRKDGDFALAWWHEYGKGRVVYSALGHREDVWTNPQVQQHFLAAIEFAGGRTK